MSTNTEPAWYQNWLKNKVEEPVPVLSISPPPDNDITFRSGETEMLRVSGDGFHVRGVKVAVDDKEAEQVYNCFKEWLTWSTINRN